MTTDKNNNNIACLFAVPIFHLSKPDKQHFLTNLLHRNYDTQAVVVMNCTSVTVFFFLSKTLLNLPQRRTDFFIFPLKFGFLTTAAVTHCL